MGLLVAACMAVSFEAISKDRPIRVNMMPKDEKAAALTFDLKKSFAFIKNQSTIASVVDDKFKWHVPASIGYLKASGDLFHSSQVAGKEIRISSWKLVYLDNFSDGEKHGWQGASTDVMSCGPSKDKSLFRNCKSKTDYVEKTFNKLGKHTEIMVEMMVHFIDQWKGELAYLQIEDEVVWTKTHNWCHTIFNHRCVLNGVNVCMNADPDLVGQTAKFVYKHSGPSVKIRFGTSLASGNCKATWGFNNFMVYVR